MATRGSSHRPLSARSTGKEEVRATLLKPYLLRLRDERGEAAARVLLSKVGIPQHVLEDETSWISLSATRRALHALRTALGDDAIASRGAWMTHPETLGAYVRMLRVASAPIDAYEYLIAHHAEATRAGTYKLVEKEKWRNGHRIRIVYAPHAELNSEQDDRVLCEARRSELAGITRLWGYPDAEVKNITCLADDYPCCTYSVSWTKPRSRRLVVGALSGALLCGGAVAASGSALGAAIGAVTGATLGAAAGALSRRVAQERAMRVLEKHRILALERGLELRGQLDEGQHELIGALLGGRYRILRRIGSGGIGAVYEAEHVALGSRVAVKVLRGAAAKDASEIARLRREAQVQVSIEHTNVVRTFDLDQMPDGSIYVVMELLHGESLAELLRKERPLPAKEAVPIFIQVCRALSAAHKLGVVHRDLKPANIFLCEDETVKVLDFGMSKFSEAEALTLDGYTLGTPEYMSPEQCVGARVEPRSDLYALGALMYEALTGEVPLPGRNQHEVLERQQHDFPATPRERRPDLDLPVALDDAVMACLKKRAAERPSSARELLAWLEDIQHDLLDGSIPSRRPASKHGVTVR